MLNSMRIQQPGQSTGHGPGMGTGAPCQHSPASAALGSRENSFSLGRISFVLFCGLNNSIEADNVQFLLTQLYLVSSSCNIAASITLKNKDVMMQGEILQTLLITSQVITINI